MQTPSDCSWIWHGIVKQKKVVKHRISYLIADVNNTLLRHDLCCGTEPMTTVERSSDSIHLPLESKVAKQITDGHSNSMVHRITNQELKDEILYTKSINLESDLVIWNKTASRSFSHKSDYHAIIKKSTKKDWA